MTETQTIPRTEKADVVTKTLSINGNEVPESMSVKEITIQKTVNKIPYARIKISDGDPADGTFCKSDKPLFIPGNEIEIKLGYNNDNHGLFKGIIVSHSNRITTKKFELTIDCKDQAEKLTVGKKNRHFENLTDSEIEEEIIGNYKGLTTAIESTSVQREKAVQFNTSDWDFILSRADFVGRICLVEDGNISIKKPIVKTDPDDKIKTALEVLFGATIMEYNAEIDARKQLKVVNALAWDYSNQEILDVTSEEPEEVESGNLTPSDLANISGLDQYILSSGGKLEEETLKDWASAKMLKSRFSKIRGKVKFQGFPGIKPGDFIGLNGVGERFSGPVFVSSVKHEYTGGNWLTEVGFGMDDKWYAERINPYHLSAQMGQFPSIQGLQVGIVTDLEDPVGEYRVKVRHPIVSTEDEGIWMRVATLDAGNQRGTFFRPEMNDEVIVGFIFNDPNHPVILGMLHSSALPAPIEPGNENHEKGYVSREGIKLIFNDEDKSVQLETPAGKKITMNDDEGKVNLEDENGNVIKMDSDGITIESAAAINFEAATDINLKGVNISLKPSFEFSASTGGSSIKANAGTIELESPAVKANGTGMTEIKGGIVKIN